MKTIKTLLNHALVVFFIWIVSSCTSQKNIKPNILFILVNNLGWSDLGCTVSKFYETPNVDRLASQGMVFRNSYATSPVSSPFRVSIMELLTLHGQIVKF